MGFKDPLMGSTRHRKFSASFTDSVVVPYSQMCPSPELETTPRNSRKSPEAPPCGQVWLHSGIRIGFLGCPHFEYGFFEAFVEEENSQLVATGFTELCD